MVGGDAVVAKKPAPDGIFLALEKCGVEPADALLVGDSAADVGAARAAGIPVERTRILAIIISTVLAGIGQIIFLQNLGTINTTSSHEQIGMFSIAALLIGGASVTKASIPNVIVVCSIAST